MNRDKKWSSRSLAPAFFHHIFYGLIRILGRPGAYFLLFFVVGFYTLLPGVGKRPAEYIRRRFKPQNRLSELRHTFLLYWNFGKMLVDRAVLRILGDFKGSGSGEDKNKLQELYAEHKRLILLTGHVGCWQMGFSYLGFLDAPKAVVMLMERGDVDKHSFKWKVSGGNGQGSESKVEEITVINPAAPMGGTLEMLSALRDNSVLCINGDRTMSESRHNVQVDFLGGKIELPITPFKIAATTDTPIAIVFSSRNKAGEGLFRVAKVIYVPADTGKGEVRGAEAFIPYAQKFSTELEKYCQDNPYQFYNFYNLWN
ncbi:acyltransferase [Maridesulfovibrio salexigens]|uniref:Acyltransferase n=1 Tax=Maridesulfovibrio salexigens (strain ATCC 14822 / DSM 2638 / NCIMB 8403 / VKM B-1763) TaxID=526222 RepID=C6BXN4_MARSD|nr:acyltransferase [Maridesulfovibrio salexigens]ACS78592.1 acyltransferase [Maridesulfovibrio salexigens DSM 2638]